MKRILCYGDSNTWGYISGSDHQRYDENQRWPKVLQNMLSKDYEVIEEGLNSRTLFSNYTRNGKEGRIGFDYLKPCMETHDKFDVIVLMLGTNELKKQYNNTPEQILEMLKKFVNFINNFKSQIDGSTPRLIISGTPLVTELDLKENKYEGAGEKSKILCDLYKNYCTQNNILFIDNSNLKTGVDGIHITLESHAELAKRVYSIIKGIL